MVGHCPTTPLCRNAYGFKSKQRVVLLGDFNARIGKGLDSDDVVGPFGEEVCNSNGTKLIELMQQSDLVLWNNREFCIEPQWTRIMPSLGQHSIVDYVASDRHLMSCSSLILDLQITFCYG